MVFILGTQYLYLGVLKVTYGVRYAVSVLVTTNREGAEPNPATEEQANKTCTFSGKENWTAGNLRETSDIGV